MSKEINDYIDSLASKLKASEKLLEDYRKENALNIERRNELKDALEKKEIQLSNYAYQIDQAKRDRDTAESKLSAMEKCNAELEAEIATLSKFDER